MLMRRNTKGVNTTPMSIGGVSVGIWDQGNGIYYRFVQGENGVTIKITVAAAM